MEAKDIIKIILIEQKGKAIFHSLRKKIDTKRANSCNPENTYPWIVIKKNVGAKEYEG